MLTVIGIFGISCDRNDTCSEMLEGNWVETTVYTTEESQGNTYSLLNENFQQEDVTRMTIYSDGSYWCIPTRKVFRGYRFGTGGDWSLSETCDTIRLFTNQMLHDSLAPDLPGGGFSILHAEFYETKCVDVDIQKDEFSFRLKGLDKIHTFKRL
jgi:hypothetical protein